jgi:hypothetical protein
MQYSHGGEQRQRAHDFRVTDATPPLDSHVCVINQCHKR